MITEIPDPNRNTLKIGDIYMPIDSGAGRPGIIDEIREDCFSFGSDTSVMFLSYSRAKGIYLRKNTQGKPEVIAASKDLVSFIENCQ